MSAPMSPSITLRICSTGQVFVMPPLEPRSRSLRAQCRLPVAFGGATASLGTQVAGYVTGAVLNVDGAGSRVRRPETFKE